MSFVVWKFRVLKIWVSYGNLYLPVFARNAATKQSINAWFNEGYGLLRYARNDKLAVFKDCLMFLIGCQHWVVTNTNPNQNVTTGEYDLRKHLHDHIQDMQM